MNLNLTTDEIQELKTLYTSWEEIKDRSSELAAEMKAVKGNAAKLVEGTVGQVGKLFKAMQELSEVGETEVDEISSMIEVIKNNGD